MKIKALWDIVRFDHEIFLAIGVLVGMLLGSATNELPSMNTIILSILSPIFIGMSSFAFNDYIDLSVDKRNRRKDRPLVRGDLSPKVALWITALGFPLGCIAAYYVNVTVFKVAIAYSIAAFLYSIWLERVPIVGNLYVASSMAVTFVFGNYVVAPHLSDPVIMFTAMALLLGFGREILKSIQEMKGDKVAGRQTLPILIGQRVSAAFAAYFMILAVIVSFMPFIFIPKYQGNLYYLIPIIVADLLIVYSAYYGAKLQRLDKIRKWSLYTVMFGLLGFLLGALI